MNRWLVIAGVVLGSLGCGASVVLAVVRQPDYALNAVCFAGMVYGLVRSQRAPRWTFSTLDCMRLGEVLKRLEEGGHSVRLEHVSNVLGWSRERTRWALEMLTAQGVLRNWED